MRHPPVQMALSSPGTKVPRVPGGSMKITVVPMCGHTVAWELSDQTQMAPQGKWKGDCQGLGGRGGGREWNAILDILSLRCLQSPSIKGRLAVKNIDLDLLRKSLSSIKCHHKVWGKMRVIQTPSWLSQELVVFLRVYCIPSGC